MSSLSDAVQGARHTPQTITWLGQNLTGASLTATKRNVDTGAVTTVDGVFAITDAANGVFTWTYGAGDVGTAGHYGVQIRATYALFDATIELSWVVHPLQSATTVPALPLVGVSPDDAAWAAAGRLGGALGTAAYQPTTAFDAAGAAAAAQAAAIANAVQRANHTGTQLAATISDFAAAALAVAAIEENEVTDEPYTAVTGDAGKAIRKASGTIIVPAILDEGDVIDIQQSGAGELAIISQGEATIEATSGALAGQYAGARLRKRPGDAWALTGQLSGTWEDVDVPDAAFNYLPFTVQRNGRRFRAETTFDLQTHANITVTKTYYVDKSTGNDANTGADWANALKTIGVALAKSDVDRVVCRNGRWLKSEMGTLPARDVEIIGAGDAVLTNDRINSVGSWTAVDNHYEAVAGSSVFVGFAFDFLYADALGLAQWLTQVATIAECDATPGSWYFNYTAPNSPVAVHLSDGRAPDADLMLGETFLLAPTADNRIYYMENLDLYGGMRLRNSSSTGGLKVYFNDCKIWGPHTIEGVTEIVYKDVTAKSLGDVFNYTARNTVVSNTVEIDCQITNISNTTSDQASTAHLASNTVRINGRYYETGGQCIADVNSSKTWMLGSEMHTSRINEVGFYMDGNAWLDHCFIHDVATDIEATTGTTSIRELISGGNFTGAGSVVEY